MLVDVCNVFQKAAWNEAGQSLNYNILFMCLKMHK